MKTVQLEPRVIGVGTTCYVTTTDNKTVLKGHQVWFRGGLVFDYEVPCEDRLAREATVYKHLGPHPQILTCFGLRGGSMRAYIQKNADSGPPIQRRLQMALDVATGLSYMHSRGALSCDLSSTNLFVLGGLRVKLGDFGGALLEGFDFKWDQTHECRYHLPSRGREYDDVPFIKRELFSLGAAIYEITAWKRPFGDLDDNQVAGRYARDEFPTLDGNVAQQIIRDCWAEAYATAQDVVDDLKILMASVEGGVVEDHCGAQFKVGPIEI